MGLNVDSFTNIKDPVKKLLDSASGKLKDKAENYVIDSLGSALSKIGIGSGSARGILANLGDAAIAGIASEFFGTLSSEINRLSKSQIKNNTGFTKTESAVDRFNDTTVDDRNRNDSSLGINKLIYPRDLEHYFIQFNFKKYKRQTPSDVATFTDEDSIYLPIPKALNDNHDISINSSTRLGIVGSIADAYANTTLNSMGGAVAGAAFDTAVEAAGLLGPFGDSLIALAEQSIGAIPNPNLSPNIEGPKLRRHAFEWLFAPNNEEESDLLRAIIKKFKASSLLNVATDTNSILTYPLMCEVNLYPWAEKGKDTYLYQFKRCLVDSVHVNYSPESPSFFGGDANAPAFIQFRISLIEMTYFTADDFGRQREAIVDKLISTGQSFIENTKAQYNSVINQSSANATKPDAVLAVGGTPVTNNDVVFAGEASGSKYLKLRNGTWMKQTPTGTYGVISTSQVGATAPTIVSGLPSGITLEGANEDATAQRDGQYIVSVALNSAGSYATVLAKPDHTGFKP